MILLKLLVLCSMFLGIRMLWPKPYERDIVAIVFAVILGPILGLVAMATAVIPVTIIGMMFF